MAFKKIEELASDDSITSKLAVFKLKELNMSDKNIQFVKRRCKQIYDYFKKTKKKILAENQKRHDPKCWHDTEYEGSEQQLRDNALKEIKYTPPRQPAPCPFWSGAGRPGI